MTCVFTSSSLATSHFACMSTKKALHALPQRHTQPSSTKTTNTCILPTIQLIKRTISLFKTKQQSMMTLDSSGVYQHFASILKLLVSTCPFFGPEYLMLSSKQYLVAKAMSYRLKRRTKCTAEIALKSLDLTSCLIQI